MTHKRDPAASLPSRLRASGMTGGRYRGLGIRPFSVREAGAQRGGLAREGGTHERTVAYGGELDGFFADVEEG
jgi:hypothetical protein